MTNNPYNIHVPNPALDYAFCVHVRLTAIHKRRWLTREVIVGLRSFGFSMQTHLNAEGLRGVMPHGEALGLQKPKIEVD
jgi:hypothetical protein